MCQPIQICKAIVLPFCVLLALLPGHREAGAMQRMSPPPLNPKTYTSPSGEYSIHINPSDRDGKRTATYRMSRRGAIVWEGKRPFTLWDVGVTNDGVVGGYAYTYGIAGWGGTKPEDYGDFEIVILDPVGKVRLDQKVHRTPGGMHSNPNPCADGLIVDAAHDRMVVQVAGQDRFRAQETWWVYQLSTGHELRQFAPKQLMASHNLGRIMDAKPIAGTPLILVQWWGRFPSDTTATRFTLIDLEGKPVWQLDLPQDQKLQDHTDAHAQSADEESLSDAILRTDLPRQFTLCVAAQKQGVTFAVVPDGQAKWRVTEASRAPYVAPARKQVRFDAPETQLILRDRIELHAPGLDSQPSIYRVFGPVSAGPHRIAFLRRDTTTDLVVVDDQGAVVYTVSLDMIPRQENGTLAKLLWRSETRFLVFVERWPKSPEDAYTEAYQVEARTGAVAKLEGFRCLPVHSVAALANGGFVVLGTVEPGMNPEIYAYDIEGRTTWALKRRFYFGPNGPPEGLFSPEALAVLRDGSLAVLDVIRHTVQLFTSGGGYLRTISLDRSWRRKASYPSGIFADPLGGFVVNDFGGTPLIYWMTMQGSVLRSYTPRYPDGREFGNSSTLVMPDRSLWVSDSYSLLQLNAVGRAAKRLGEVPSADQLHKIVEMAIRPGGRILAADERTNAVHIFDAQGRWLYMCNPHKSGQESPSMFRTIEKEIEFGPANTFAIDGVWFDADGKRCGKPSGYQPVKERLRRKQRRPDGTWLEDIDNYAVAPDGALAVVDARHTPEGDSQPYLSLFPATGTLGQLIALPSAINSYPEIAYDGKQVVLVDEGHVYSYRSTGKPLWQFTLPNEKAGEKSETEWTPFLTNGGRTLCLFDGKRTLYRYSMP
jgi:hypothetical protein